MEKSKTKKIDLFQDDIKESNEKKNKENDIEKNLKNNEDNILVNETKNESIEKLKKELKTDDNELTEKEKKEIDDLKAKLKEIKIPNSIKDSDNNEKVDTTKVVPTPIKEIEDDGEISLQVVSSTDEEVKRKIAQIKSELNADLSFKDKFKNLFKSKKQKQLENELIEKKAIKLQKKSKKEIKYVSTNFKSTIGLFSIFYSRNDMKWRIFVACMVGLIISFVSIVFVQNTGVVVTGLSGIFQGIARITKVVLNKNRLNLGLTEDNIQNVYNAMFYGMYLLMNIPLMIFSYKKVGKNFTIISSIPVIISNVVPLIINLIPGVSNIFIFGETTSNYVQIALGSDGKIIDPMHLEQINSDLHNNGVTILTFMYKVVDGRLINDAPKFLSMLLYTICAGIINGFAYSMAMAVGGSSGGLDFISFYFAYKRNKSLAPVLLGFNIGSVVLTTMLGSYISAIVVNPQKYSSYEYFFSQNLLTGFIYALTLSIVISNLFPKDKVVKITIYGSKVFKIRNHLYSKNFNHSLTINNTTGGYSLTEQKNIEIICMFIEIPKILQEIKSCDQPSLITITRIKGIEGKLTIENAIN